MSFRLHDDLCSAERVSVTASAATDPLAANESAGGYALGIDVGGTKIHALAMAGSQLAAEEQIATKPGPEALLESILGLSARLAKRLRIDPDGFTSVGIGIPGLVDPADGHVRQALNLDINDWQLGAQLRRAFCCPIGVENDVKASALGAATLLAGPKANIAYLNVGTGTAMAAVSDGKLVRGENNAAGEIGHLAVFPQAAECICGQAGCIESISGGGPVQTRLNALGLGLAELFDLPDEAAHREAEAILTGIELAVRVAVAAYDPATIFLAGGVVENAPGLFERLIARLDAGARHSHLLAELNISARMSRIPPGIPVAALGAVEVGRSSRRETGKE
jgi:predicted NBD/HSP70 family sugar kinase